jgi:cysteine desulfurase/selenocysteine lyase
MLMEITEQSKNTMPNFDVEKIRLDFPILQTEVHKKPLVYLDNAATTQKPTTVLEEIQSWYTHKNSNIHRGVHFLSQQATDLYENARTTVKNFINAEHLHEVIFTHGTTESINTVAFSYGERFVHKGDEILITEMEHHANIVPWQLLAERKGAHVKYIEFDENGELMLDSLDELITNRTRIVCLTYVSNALGTINPVKKIIAKAKEYDIPVLIDAAQAIQHIPIDVQDLDCDFLVFSGHKVYGPTGIGVLYGKQKWLEAIPPYMGGGDMVDKVSMKGTTFNVLPFKFEAGTTNYVAAAGMAKGIEYINNIGLDVIAQHEHEILEYAQNALEQISNITIYGKAKEKTSVISFLLDRVHPYDVGMILDKMGVAVRTGTHCSQPVMEHFDIPGTVRASISFYNNKTDIDRFLEALETAKMMLS